MAIKVYIRVDGNETSGLGHLVRCIALADMLKNTFRIIFVCRQIPAQLVKQLNSNNFDLIEIDDEASFFSKINAGDIVVLDGYHFDFAYQKMIKAKQSKLVCIDDLHDKNFAADLIINHVPGVRPEDYQAQPYTKFALGLSFALLRDSFLKQARTNYTEKKQIKSVFVCFGGSDPKNLTEHTFAIVKSLNNFERICIVTGAAYSNIDSLKLAVAQDKRVIHHHAIDEQKMLAVLKTADLAIVPASGVLFEALTIKIPIITGWYINNQSIFIAEMTKYKQVINANDFSEANLREAINYILHTQIEYDNVFDGHSGERINALFENL